MVEELVCNTEKSEESSKESEALLAAAGVLVKPQWGLWTDVSFGVLNVDLVCSNFQKWRLYSFKSLTLCPFWRWFHFLWCCECGNPSLEILSDCIQKVISQILEALQSASQHLLRPVLNDLWHISLATSRSTFLLSYAQQVDSITMLLAENTRLPYQYVIATKTCSLEDVFRLIRSVLGGHFLM